MTFIKHVYHAIRHGCWQCGFESKKTWLDKPTFGVYRAYYDGYHFAVHIWRFYIGVEY